MMGFKDYEGSLNAIGSICVSEQWWDLKFSMNHDGLAAYIRVSEQWWDLKQNLKLQSTLLLPALANNDGI